MMRHSKFYYTILVVILALISVWMAFVDLTGSAVVREPWFMPVDNAILIFFAAEYFVNLYVAADKKQYIRRHLFDLIAILPFNMLLSAFRLTRVLQLARLMQVTKLLQFVRLVAVFGRLRGRTSGFLRTNGLIYVIYANTVCIFLGAGAIYLLERGKTINTFGDAVWWAFVTATTVGYGDLSPCTPGGRIVAGILMIVGIGLISMLTGTVATYFSREKQTSKKLRRLTALAEELSEPELEALITQLKNSDRRIAATDEEEKGMM